MLVNENDREIIQHTIKKADEGSFFVDKQIVVFGCNLYARDIKEILCSIGKTIHFFIDNNLDKQNKYCLGIRVISPQKLVHEGTVIIIASKYQNEMIGQLKGKGVPSKNILSIPVSETLPHINLEKNIEESKNIVFEGIYAYQKTQTKYPDMQKMFVCPYPGTGDIYMACGYFKEYLHRVGINRYVFCVLNNSCKKVAQLFDIQNIEIISEKEKDQMIRSWEFLGSHVVNIKPLLYWGWRSKRYLYSDDYPDITFSEMFKYDVYELDSKVEFEHPMIDRKSDFAERFFLGYGAEKGRTVVLAPYAGSFISDINEKKWIELVQHFKRNGFSVFTNCYGDKEQPLDGTIPICFPYNEAVNVLEYAGYFVGIRSGLCDVISSANCHMVIIYESEFSASNRKFFGLVNMGLNRQAKEIDYNVEMDFATEVYRMAVG